MAMSPNTDNYTLGKGVVYFNQKDPTTGEFMGERDLGNATAFSFNIAIEKLAHYSSRGGLKAKDKEIVSQMTPAIAFTLDELNNDNFAMLTLADVTTVSQTGDTIDDEVHVAHLGMRIALDERGISAVEVADDIVPTITYVMGPSSNPLANYYIDTSLKDDAIGRILIHADQSGCANAITEDQDLYISYTSAAVDYTVIKAFANTQVEGFMRFVSDNPAGDDRMVKIWNTSLAPAGDTSMIGDDFSTLGFTGEVLKDEVGHPDNPYMAIESL